MKIENLIIEGYGGCYINAGIENNELDTEIYEEGYLNQNYELSFYTSELNEDEEYEKKDKVASVSMTYMDVCMAEECGYSICELFDLIDSEKQGVYEYLYDDEEPNIEYVGIDADVMYIDSIFVEKKFRNKGVGSIIVRNLSRIIRHFLKLKPGCLVLLANPYEEGGEDRIIITNKKEIEKLISFYEKNGFERIKNTQYLVKNMDFKD